MEVFAGVVVVRVTIPSAFPRIPGLVLLGVMDAEVVGLEPSNPKIRSRDTAREVAEVVIGDDGARCVRWT